MKKQNITIVGLAAGLLITLWFVMGNPRNKPVESKVPTQDRTGAAGARETDNESALSSNEVEQAISIARTTAAKVTELPDSAAATVVSTNHQIIVTFPMKLAPGVRGPDYFAKVFINRKTKQVENLLGPP